MTEHSASLRSYYPIILGLLGSQLCVLNGLGQGLITFGNGVPIYDIDGKTPLAGSEFLAELYAGPPGGSLQPISSSITPFSAAPGYFSNPIAVSIPGVPAGGDAVVQVVAWRANDGATFAEANHPGGHVGISAIFDEILSSSTGPPPPQPATLSAMQSFSLQVVVPEPSVLIFGLLSAGGWAGWRQMRRRRVNAP